MPLPGAMAGAVPVGEKVAANPKNLVQWQYHTPHKLCVQTEIANIMQKILGRILWLIAVVHLALKMYEFVMQILPLWLLL